MSIDIDKMDMDDMENDEIMDIGDDNEKSEDIAIEVEDEMVEGGVVLSKHSQNGKHSLKYDVIFKGKKDKPEDEDEFFTNVEDDNLHNNNFSVDVSTVMWEESMNNENYVRQKRVKEKIYEILVNYTTIDMSANRRKPSAADFNKYFYTIKTQLADEKFSNIEILVELAFYFSENLYNMFELLYNNWKNEIMHELIAYVGKTQKNLDVCKKNLKVDSEIEFKVVDETSDDIKLINGIIVEVNYDESMFRVNSFERIHDVHLDNITKIVSNNRYKYNLNKLINLDFI